jgi:hypothetical protein
MFKEDKKESLKDQFKMKTPETCLAAIKNGWIAGLVSIALTLLVVTIGMLSNSDDSRLSYFADPMMFIDIGLMIVMVFFIYKKSRVAATCMFLYFVLSKYIQWTDLGDVQGLPMALIFMFFYFNAMRGTYRWHSKFKLVDSVKPKI